MIPIQTGDFPFDIMDVAALLRLNIRRRGPDGVYVDCPICGDRRGKTYLNTSKNVWRCNYCSNGGGMLALYGRVHGLTNSEAYHAICDDLMTGDDVREYRDAAQHSAPAENQAEKADARQIHQTFACLLSMLTLSDAHREHLRICRGLNDEQILAYGFKSTPNQFYCRYLASQLQKAGCTVQGVPGFYLDDKGRWTIRFYSRTAGIIIPMRSIDGLICGIQTRLDHPIRNPDDPPEKSGVKYLSLSSAGKSMGTSCGSMVHFIGDPGARVVYVTEGALKADVAHALTGRSFLATVGANNVSQLDGIFSFLKKNGTEEIIEAEDMDKYRNRAVSSGASKVYRLARKHGLSCRRLTWNPRYKGIDDWQLALREQKAKEKEERNLDMQPDSGTISQRFRIYQIDLESPRIVPYAFLGMEELRSLGYRSANAEDYRLMYDGVISRTSGQRDDEVLEHLFERFNLHHPGDFHGHSLSVSDVVELYDETQRNWFYCDTFGFVPTDFCPERAAAMKMAQT